MIIGACWLALQAVGGKCLKSSLLKPIKGADNLNTISKSTRKLYQSLRSEVVGIHYRLRIIRQLFTSQTTCDLLNKTAKCFFTTLEWDLLDTIVLAINRLLDPPKTSGKYPNASLQQLVDSLDPTAHAPLIAILRATLDQVRAKSARIKHWRDKWVGHRDFDVVCDQTPKPATSLKEIDEVLALIRKFMNEFERACQDPHVEIEINIYGKTASKVEEIAESEKLKERLKIGPPINYENMIFQDDGNTIIEIIKRGNPL